MKCAVCRLPIIGRPVSVQLGPLLNPRLSAPVEYTYHPRCFGRACGHGRLRRVFRRAWPRKYCGLRRVRAGGRP